MHGLPSQGAADYVSGQGGALRESLETARDAHWTYSGSGNREPLVVRTHKAQIWIEQRETGADNGFVIDRAQVPTLIAWLRKPQRSYGAAKMLRNIRENAILGSGLRLRLAESYLEKLVGVEPNPLSVGAQRAFCSRVEYGLVREKGTFSMPCSAQPR